MLRLAYIVVVSFAVTFYLTMRSGLINKVPDTQAATVFLLPLLICSFIFLLLSLYHTARNFKSYGTGHWLWVLAVVLMVSGYWTSCLTRYHVETIITEGQTITSKDIQPIFGKGYVGKFAWTPIYKITLKELTPIFANDSKNLKSLSGDFVCESENSNAYECTIDDFLIPTRLGLLTMSLNGFGYSPRYTLKNKAGRFLDSSFVFLDIFPESKEGMFRLLSPLTYYVRYHPSKKDTAVVGLRVTRNKDIVFNGSLKLGQDAVYENAKMSFDEVRKWARVSIVSDKGALIFYVGMALALLSFVVYRFSVQRR